jgi:hypothetical protein
VLGAAEHFLNPVLDGRGYSCLGAGQMNFDPDVSALSQDAPGPRPSSTADDLWKVIQEQRERIERLEAVLPLPEASERVEMGRAPVIGPRARRRHRRQVRIPAVSAEEAFKDLAPITARYATVPILEGFNWDDCATRVPEGQWYMVVFRSVRREAIDDLTLEMHDYGAHIEASRRAVGLVHYFRGTPNEHRECLSFCIWRNRKEAARAAQLPLHRVAMAMTEEKYEWYALERYNLRKVRGRDGIEIEPVDPPLAQG